MTSEASEVERAVFGVGSVDEIRTGLEDYLGDRLGVGVEEVVFRSGRIDAVWGLGLDDGRRVVVKAHRQPVDLAARTATVEAQRALVAAGFPCPEPLSGPDTFRGAGLSVESMAPPGEPVDGREPGIRRALATGCTTSWRSSAGCRGSLSGRGEVPPGATTSRARGRCRTRASSTSAVHRRTSSGSTTSLAGITAAAYGSSPVHGDGLSTPDEMAAFLRDHDDARSRPFDTRQQRVAVAAAAWTLAYDARCALSFLEGEPAAGSSLALLRDHGRKYLDLRW